MALIWRGIALLLDVSILLLHDIVHKRTRPREDMFWGRMNMSERHNFVCSSV